MKKNRFILLLVCCLAAFFQSQAQNLVCNDLVQISLDEDCAVTIDSSMILEGSCNCPAGVIVELDKTAPFGNGPWEIPLLTKADVGKTYQCRVTSLSTGNKCWGNIKAEDKLPPKVTCPNPILLDLGSNGSVSLTRANASLIIEEPCTDSAQIAVTFNGQASLAYNCDKLGPNTVTVRATDGSGNQGTCQTTVLVSDPLGNCSGFCINSCPANQTVTLNEGYGTLLPALQAGNLAAFDAYGYPVFDTGTCPLEDTTHTVTYTPSASGFSWFTRKWEAILNGVPFGRCSQHILFPSTRTITFSGRVFVDSIQNCQPEASELGVRLFPIVATKLPSNQNFAVQPNANGDYVFPVEVNGLDTAVLLRINMPAGLSTVCPTALSVPALSGPNTYAMNFGLYAETSCPLLTVDLTSGALRRCFDNNSYYIQYCNQSYQPASNAYITLALDSLLSVTNSQKPFTQSGNVYTFQLGTVPAFSCQTFRVQIKADCATVLGQTKCVEATIYPHDPCNGAALTGPRVYAYAACEGDSVRLVLRNIGTSDMTQELNYIVVEDILMLTGGKFNLKTGDEFALKVPANGATWRIEADQVPSFPLQDWPSAFMEGCGGLNIPGLVNAFPLNDPGPYNDIECETIVGAHDPNDKSATPTGYGEHHLIRANTDFEYKIRFQNTGTDTAFRVVIVDTLSPLLDARTIQPGASSHKYRFEKYEGGIIRFVFDNILLPDSNVNQAASNGFASFRISQKPDLPDGTVIENNAAIYFDFNDPIITNTVFHTIGDPYLLVSTKPNPKFPTLQLSVAPNPFQDQATLTATGHTLRDGQLFLYDGQGRLLRTQRFQGNQCTLERGDLNSGVYFLRIMDQGAFIGTGTVIVR